MTIVRFSLSRIPLYWLIAGATCSLYGHVEFELPDGKLLAALPEGVILRDPPDDDMLVKKLVLDTDQGTAYAMSQLGKPYDWSGVISLPFNRDWQEPDSWFCSELVAESLQLASVIDIPNVSRVTPGDLFRLLCNQPKLVIS